MRTRGNEKFGALMICGLISLQGLPSYASEPMVPKNVPGNAESVALPCLDTGERPAEAVPAPTSRPNKGHSTQFVTDGSAVNQPPATQTPTDAPSCTSRTRTRYARALVRLLAEVARAATY
jgi:hypothetical protein